MRKILIGICLLVLFLEISGLIYSRTTEQPNEALMALQESPEWVLQDPRQNGYFLLLGFASPANVNPIAAGHEMWFETTVAPSRTPFHYAQGTRSALFLPPDLVKTLTALSGRHPIRHIQEDATRLQRQAPQYSLLASRYLRWLDMPFEDRGFAHAGHLRFEEMFAAHRGYLGEGFSTDPHRGLQRLEQDFLKWRAMLTEAKTLSLKVFASLMVAEDTAILSDILSQPTLPQETLVKISTILTPLTQEEGSLRWPIRHEFLVGLARSHQSLTPYSPAEDTTEPGSSGWLAYMADLHPDSFQGVTPSLTTSLLGYQFHSQRTKNIYAIYYQAMIKASEDRPGPLPRLTSVAQTFSRTLVDTLLHPIHQEPTWEHFRDLLLSTNARVRLAGLQALLRRPSQGRTITTQIAEAGGAFYDPFTGLPFLWNPDQHRLYSVGKDFLDDGGDSIFDIAVPVMTKTTGSRPTARTDHTVKRSTKFQRGQS